MNKLLPLFLTSVYLSISSYVAAADGEVDFTGSITDVACTVENNMTNPLTVVMGTAHASNLREGSGNTGRFSNPVYFSIRLTDCPAALDGKTAQVKFDGTPATSDNKILALTPGSNVATGVGIQITNETMTTIIPIFQASPDFTLHAGFNELRFVSRYVGFSDTITPGVANSTANFTVVYN